MMELMQRVAGRVLSGGALLAGLLLLVGCEAAYKPDIAGALYSGNYGRVRVELHDRLAEDRGDRDYVLTRMRAAVMTMADGYPHAANVLFEELYDTLRIQGLNADRTVASIVVNENVKIWKGEPFEQALAFTYYGLQQASLGSWDNARAALDNALFYLRDFRTEDDEGQQLDITAIAERATAEDAEEDYLDAGYVAERSDYALGYLLAGIANQQLAREEEANENLALADRLVVGLDETVKTLRARAYNTVLVVGWGLGPAKRAEGLDGALAVFRARTGSGLEKLRVSVGGEGVGSFPVVTNVNRMATDHRWNNLEDVRTFKAIAGTGLLYGGLAATQAGLNNDDNTLVLAGVIAAASGALLKASARADTRYCEAFAQRYYVVPLMLEKGQTIELALEGKPGSRLVLAGLGPPGETELAQLRYVRLPTGPGLEQRRWATSGEVCYETDWAAATLSLHGEAGWPLPLGGRDARTPDEAMLQELLDRGVLPGITYGQLLGAYRDEGWRLTVQDQYGRAGLHVLEGGRSLVAPLAGTTGFVRLFGRIHPAYAGE
ncbi:hypothetical protein [Mucisphaera sp.]|uniref:hypothetical protein n=1 Tax=Mucisphaera sp. TaxID=2913024 RepID=UPI003D127E1D